MVSMCKKTAGTNQVPQISPENAFHEDTAQRLAEIFGKSVCQITVFDSECELYPLPERVEFHIIELDNTVLLCEFDLWLNHEHVYEFNRQCVWYEKYHPECVIRKIMIAPQIDEHSKSVATFLGIELHKQPEDVYRYKGNIETL